MNSEIRVRLRTGCLLAALLLAASARAAEVQVAVAANFSAPMKSIAAGFEQDKGHKLVLIAGSTGKLYAQIGSGAPYEVLLAADAETPARLEREGRAVAGSRFTYAVGRLALWSRAPDGVDDQGQVLRRGAFRHLAIADPKIAPYGAAAMEVLAGLGLGTTLAPKFVQGESTAQAYQFVATGNAELGFVALSQVFADGRLTQGSAWMVPQNLHAPIRQDAVLLDRGRKNAAAAELLAYLRGEKAKQIMRKFGYAF